MKNYKEEILQFINQTTEPLDVEKIQKACNIGNWNTALKHCLELHIQGKIKGQKTPKGWMFWPNNEETLLKPWKEAIGSYETLEVNQNKVTLTLALQSLRITFPKNSQEAETLIQTLTNTPRGTKIAILKTDNPQKPLLLKILNETTDAQKTRLWLLWFRRSLFLITFMSERSVALKFSLTKFELRLCLWGLLFA